MVGHASKPSFKDASSYEPVGLVHPSSRGSDEEFDDAFSPSKDPGESSRKDSMSLNSAAHLNPRSSMSSPLPAMPIPHADYASASASRPPVSQASSAKFQTHKHNNSSWDLLAGIKKDYEEFDPRNAKEAHLQFAQGDIPDNTVSCNLFHHGII